MSAGRRLPNLLLAVFVMLVVTGLTLLCIAVVTKLLQQAVRKAEDAARQKATTKSLKQLGAAHESYHNVPAAPAGQGKDPPAESHEGSLPEPQIRGLAIRYKDAWLKTNPDKALEGATISEIEKTGDGWDVTFETTAPPGGPKGGGRRLLDVYLAADGKLIKVARRANETQ